MAPNPKMLNKPNHRRLIALPEDWNCSNIFYIHRRERRMTQTAREHAPRAISDLESFASGLKREQRTSSNQLKCFVAAADSDTPSWGPSVLKFSHLQAGNSPE